MREVGRRRLNFGSGELIEVKRMFGVSAAALVVRMRDLGIIAEGTVGEIFRGVGKSWRRDEPSPLERTESPGRFRRLCLRALAEGAISESKAAELLGTPRQRNRSHHGRFTGPVDNEYPGQRQLRLDRILQSADCWIRMFELHFQFAVPDLLFEEELIDLGMYSRQDLLDLGPSG